jgi:hypothetical protein
MEEELDELPRRKRWPLVAAMLVVALGAGGLWYSQQKHEKPELPQRTLFRKQLPGWVAARSRNDSKATELLAACVTTAQPWPAVATALAALDAAWDSEPELRRSTKELNQALHAAALDFWVDPQFPNNRPILTTYEILARSTWTSESSRTETLHVRRLDTLNLALGLLGHAGGDQPAVLRDRVEMMVVSKLATVDDEKLNEVDRLVAKVWREQLGKLIDASAFAEAERRLNERERLARIMEQRLRGGQIHVARPERLVFGDAYFEGLEPYTSTRRRGGPLIMASDLRALQRADWALDDSAGLQALVRAIELEGELVEAHEAHHALDPGEVPTPALLQSLVGADDLRFGRMAERELRAFLGELRDARPPACLSVLSLAQQARGRYAQSTPHFFAAHALLSTIAQRDGSRGLSVEQVAEVTRELCALPDAELRARANTAAQTLYGAPLRIAKRE